MLLTWNQCKKPWCGQANPHAINVKLVREALMQAGKPRTRQRTTSSQSQSSKKSPGWTRQTPTYNLLIKPVDQVSLLQRHATTYDLLAEPVIQNANIQSPCGASCWKQQHMTSSWSQSSHTPTIDLFIKPVNQVSLLQQQTSTYNFFTESVIKNTNIQHLH